jgi:DNA primase
MKKEGVDFGEALRILAQKAGVSLTTKQDEESKGESERLKEMNEAAAEYYHYLLLHSSAGEVARSYLAQRGISDKTIEEFQLGFSPDSWEALREQLMKKGYPEKELVAAGLLVEKESSPGKDSRGTYDRFRNRLMFPIRDIAGRVLGFGARTLDDSLPKYLNSPQTLIFDKSSSLYGIEKAKSAIRKQNMAVVVEGYMDVIVAHQYGFNNVVASLGTALTERQVGIIKKLTKTLTLALDADAAGEIATLRGIEVASHTFDQKMVPLPTSEGLIKYENLLDAEIRVMVLPPGKDPDDIIKESPEEWERLLKEAPPVVDYTFDLIVSKLDLTKLKDKSLAVDQLLPLIAGIKHPVRQAHYLQKLARLVAIDEQNLALALSRLKRPAKLKGEVDKTLRGETVQLESFQGKDSRPSTLIPLLSSTDPLAEYCLSLLLHYPQLRSHTTELSADFFPHSEDREIFLAWRSATDLDSMRQELDATLKEHLDALLSKALPPLNEEEQEQALRECVYRLQERWLKDLKAKEERLISDAQAEGGTAELEEIQQLALKLNTQLREVFLQRKSKLKSFPWKDSEPRS